MKKFAKMSLAAVVALAGLTSTASAGSLEEAIKGVDISGKVRYRMEEISNGQEDQDVNIDVNVQVPVNDMVTFVGHLNIDNDNQESGVTYSNPDLENYYFQYANGPVTVLLGTQEIPGRLTDGLSASGVVGLYNAGAFTVGAASFYNSEASSEMINSVIAMGSVGPVSALAQYVNVDDVMDVYNVKADAAFGPAKVGVEYSEKELDSGANKDDRSTLKAYVSGSIAMVSAKLSYAQTGDNGGGSIDNAAETASEWLLWQLGTKNNADMTVYGIDASVKATDKITLRAAYADGEIGSGDVTETLGQISYKMSKNLNTYVRYSNYEKTTGAEVQRGRLEVSYSF